MKLKRYMVDLSIPLDQNDALPAVYTKKLSEALSPTDIQDMLNLPLIDAIDFMIGKLKEGAAKDPDDPTRIRHEASKHVCMHELGLPCQPGEEIIPQKPSEILSKISKL